MSQDECRKYLRYLELDAYAKMISVLRAQGPLTESKQKLLGDLAKALHIPNERHQAEIRRAVNDDKLSFIAEQLFGPNTDTEWTVEGRRIIPLYSRLKGRSAFTTFANSLSLTTAVANEKQPYYQCKKEVKFKGGSQYQSKFDEKLVNNSENKFISRKRKRSLNEISGLNNFAYSSYPSTSSYQSNPHSRNSAKQYSKSTLEDQYSIRRQRIDNLNSEEYHSIGKKDFGKIS